MSKNLDTQIKIYSQNHQYGKERYRSIYWFQILSLIIFNNQNFPRLEYSKYKSLKRIGGDLLISCPDKPEFLYWGDSIRRFRNE